MLVLTRRVGEVIVIAGDIRITVVAVQGTKVRLGVLAPRDVTVDRQEIHEKRAAAPDEGLGRAAAPPLDDSGPLPVLPT